MVVETRVVDDRVFLLSLDEQYRASMKLAEMLELLPCARRVAEALQVSPAQVAVEGYYGESQDLTEYFRLVRALQDVNESETSSVDGMPEFQRLLEVTSSAIYGRPIHNRKLLPMGRDPLSRAMWDVRLWTVPELVAAAHRIAVDGDDFSLVGLAAFADDAVVLAALRESVVLYAEIVALGGEPLDPPSVRYEWRVSEELARRAARFVDTFNALFGKRLPPAEARFAPAYWTSWSEARIEGRCVRLGGDDRTDPPMYYHWAICTDRSEEQVVQEFWAPEVWTTDRYRSLSRRFGSGCPPLQVFEAKA
jgi:hypothetical protein